MATFKFNCGRLSNEQSNKQGNEYRRFSGPITSRILVIHDLLWFLIIACKILNYSRKQTDDLLSAMKSSFDEFTEEHTKKIYMEFYDECLHLFY